MAADLAEVVAELRDTAAHLAEHIEARAAEIAGPRIAAAEQIAAERIGQAEAAAIVDGARADALVAELRRQLAARDKQVARLRWVVRYLPPELRSFVLADPPTPDAAWTGDRPDGWFSRTVDLAAEQIGLAPYPSAKNGLEEEPVSAQTD